ncbi:MAG: TetR/AcrR family transcriptional regulator, cholesterol catabolism regulator [Frankiales bacterium]|nr:TetR/AcrR family transcriptional regulator, cholesterol catabolism regulator [Frankiales bacterium]
MTTTAPAQVDSETAAQRARRARIISATLSLASRGGYEAVQMREVAERSEVALGTLYRYFPSKVHLLVSAMASEVDQLSQRLQKRQPPGKTRAERVSFVLERSTRSLQRDPLLTEAMVRAMMAADVTVAQEVNAVRQGMSDLIVQAIRGDDGVQEHDVELAAILQDVWFARQIAWLGGRIEAADVWRDIHLAIGLVLADD